MHGRTISKSISQTALAVPVPTILDSHVASLTTATAVVSLSIVAAAAAGPSAAGDVQAMSAIALMDCTSAAASSQRSFRTLSPTALSETASGALAGNVLLVACVSLVHSAALGLLSIASARLSAMTSWAERMAAVRYPGIPLAVAAATFQGSIFSAGKLAAEGDVGCAAAFAACLLLPIGLIFVVSRLPRQYYRYNYDYVGDGFLYRWWSVPLRPTGVIFPENMRRALLSLVSGVTLQHPSAVLIPFASPVIIGIGSLVRVGQTHSECTALMSTLCVLHVLLAGLIVIASPLRSVMSNVLTATGLGLTSLLLLLSALADPSNPPPRSQLDVLIGLQVVCGLLRLVLSYFLGRATSSLEVNATPKILVWSSNVSVKADVKGVLDGALPDTAVPLLLEEVLPCDFLMINDTRLDRDMHLDRGTPDAAPPRPEVAPPTTELRHRSPTESDDDDFFMGETEMVRFDADEKPVDPYMQYVNAATERLA